MSTEKIVIYSNFAQRLSSWCLKGSSGSYSIPLSKSINYDTILLLCNGDNVDFKLSPAKESFLVGDDIQVASLVRGSSVRGKIVEINERYIDIDDHDAFHRVYDYKHLMTPSKQLQGCLSVDLTNKVGSLNLSYLFGHVGWKAHYIVFFDNNQMTLKLIGTIRTAETLSGEIILVAGDVPLRNQDAERSIMVRSAQSSQLIQGTEMGEYYRYEVGHKCLKDGAKIDIFTQNLTTQKLYYHETASLNRVTYGYIFKASEFLPTGEAYLYQEELMYVGMGRIDETRQGDEVEIRVGATSQVQVQTKISESSISNTLESDNQEKDSSQTENPEKEIENKDMLEIESAITNHTGKSITLIISHYVGDRKILSSNFPFIVKNGYIQWKLHVSEKKIQGNISVTLVKMPSVQ